jgi:hypothetical protein
VSNLPPDIKRIRDAQLARLRPNPDGTLVPRDPSRADVADLAIPATPLKSGKQGYIDDYTAAQLGLVQILNGLTFHVTDVKALIEKDTLETRAMDFGGRVYLDHPDPEDDRTPTPSATITEGGPPTYDLPGPLSGQQYAEGSEGVWGEGTILRVAYHGTYALQVVCWLAHKDDRAAVRQGLVSAFFAEPRDQRSGRLVALPWYFDQVARYTMTAVSYPDTDEQATQGTWPLVADIKTEVVGVYLVPMPGYLQRAQVDVGDLTD